MSIKNFKENISNCIKEIQSKNYKLTEAKKFSLVYVLVLFLTLSLIPSGNENVSKNKQKTTAKTPKKEYAFTGTIICKNKYKGVHHYSISGKSITNFYVETPFGKSSPNIIEPLSQNSNGYVKWKDYFYDVNAKKIFYVINGKPSETSNCTVK